MVRPDVPAVSYLLMLALSLACPQMTQFYHVAGKFHASA